MTEERERKVTRVWAWFVYAMVVIYLSWGVYVVVTGVRP